MDRQTLTQNEQARSVLLRLAYSLSALALVASLFACGQTGAGDARASTPDTAVAQASHLTASVLYWAIDGLTKARAWVSPDGRTGVQSTVEGSTAVDYWPTLGNRPHVDSLAELTLQRHLWSDSAMERMNWSAMVDETDGGAFRFGVERAGTGIHRPILFCFEDFPHGSGQAFCPLKLDTTGAHVLRADGTYHTL